MKKDPVSRTSKLNSRNSKVTDSLDTETTNSIPLSKLSESSIHGILRKPSIAKRQSPVLPISTNVVHIRHLWKHGSLLLIPIFGYILSQLYPTSMLLHFTFLCFVYGLVDLIDQDPTFGFIPPQKNKLHTLVEQQRLRRVSFVDGTKFYRLPKPMSRKQKQQVLCEQRFPLPPAQWNVSAQSAQKSTPCSVSQSLSMDSMTINTSITTKTTTTTKNPATIDWEATSRLLKSIIERRTTSEDSCPDIDFHDAQQTEHISDQLSSFQENAEPTRSKRIVSPSKLIGGDDAIARLRRATKPLQEVNRQQ